MEQEQEQEQIQKPAETADTAPEAPATTERPGAAAIAAALFSGNPNANINTFYNPGTAAANPAANTDAEATTNANANPTTGAQAGTAPVTATVYNGDPFAMERRRLTARQKSHRTWSVIMLAFSAFNILTVMFSQQYYYFSLMSTLLLSEFSFTSDRSGNITGLRGAPVLLTLGGMCLVVIAIYLAAVLLSKKTIIAAWVSLVLFLLDTLLLVNIMWSTADSSLILNTLYHIWILCTHIMLFTAHYKLRRLEKNAG